MQIGKWWEDIKEGIRTYIRTFVIIWQCGPLTLLCLMLLTLLMGILPAGDFFVMEHLVNAITTAIGDPNWWHQVLPWILGMAGFQIFRLFASNLEGPLGTHLREKIEVVINEGIVQKANTTELVELQTGEFQNALARARSVSGVDFDDILWNIIGSLQYLISVLTLGIVLWGYHPVLTFIPALTGIISWWSTLRFAADHYYFEVQHTPQQRERSALEGLLINHGAGKEVRLYQAQKILIGHWQKLWQIFIQGKGAIERRKFLAHLALNLLRGLLYACALIFLLLPVFRKTISLGTYIAASAAVLQLEGIWNSVARSFNWIAEDMRRLSGDLYPFLDKEVDTLSQKADASASKQKVSSVVEPQLGFSPIGSQADNTDAIQDIVLENVSFFYPNAKKPALNHTTLTFKAGERVALVGPNGAGKTTLARLLIGLYRPHTGIIRIGNMPLDVETRPDWLKHCSAVFQDFTKYHLTAKENIIFGDIEHSERMGIAASAGGAVSVIDGLPNGYDTILGPTFGGRNLSGGEWQRIATARSFMRETPWLVILDEPTAALDPLAEQVAYEQFIRRSTGRTSVLISHRLSSVRSCDRILVLDNGTIVEDGSHEALLKKDGLYLKLFNAQSQWYI